MATVAEHKDCDILYMSYLYWYPWCCGSTSLLCVQFSGVEIEELLSPGFFSVTARKELQKKKINVVIIIIVKTSIFNCVNKLSNQMHQIVLSFFFGMWINTNSVICKYNLKLLISHCNFCNSFLLSLTKSHP